MQEKQPHEVTTIAIDFFCNDNKYLPKRDEFFFLTLNLDRFLEIHLLRNSCKFDKSIELESDHVEVSPPSPSCLLSPIFTLIFTENVSAYSPGELFVTS